MTGPMSRDDWEVTLDVADTDTAEGQQGPSDIGEADSGTTTWKTGGAATGTGTWSGSFWGEDNTTHPTAVTGAFNAQIGGAATISGAFCRG